MGRRAGDTTGHEQPLFLSGECAFGDRTAYCRLVNFRSWQFACGLLRSGEMRAFRPS
jgi:hypothetical protein